MQTIGCKVLFKCTDKDYLYGDQDFDQLELGVAGAASDTILVHRREIAVALQEFFLKKYIQAWHALMSSSVNSQIIVWLRSKSLSFEFSESNFF